MRAGLVLGVVLAACYSPRPTPGAPCAANGACPAGLVCTSDNRCELTEAPDAPRTDDAAMIEVDACPGCPVLVARYRFEGDFSDDTGAHPASVVGVAPQLSAGPDADAELLAGGHLLVPNAAAFEIDAGRVELDVYAPSDILDGDLGLISRDANGTALGGHIGIRLGHDRRVVARIQRMSSPTVEAYRCTADPISLDAWHHIEVAFGPGGFILSVDGVESTGDAWLDTSANSHDCTTPWTMGIAGNTNPWVFGALTTGSVEGTGAPVSAPATHVRIDDIAIWALP